MIKKATDRAFDSVGKDDVEGDGPGTPQLLGPPLLGPVIVSDTSADSAPSAGAEIGNLHIRTEVRLDKSRPVGDRHAEPTRDAPAQVARRFRHHGAQNVIFPHDDGSVLLVFSLLSLSL